MQKRLFTLEEANGLLPWLEARLRELDPYHEEIARQQQEEQVLLRKGRSNGGSERVEEELLRCRQLVQELRRSMQDVLDQILRRGIIVRNLDPGLVDFPSPRDGREVYLCWVRGEAQVDFWHETDTGFAGRKPL